MSNDLAKRLRELAHQHPVTRSELIADAAYVEHLEAIRDAARRTMVAHSSELMVYIDRLCALLNSDSP